MKQMLIFLLLLAFVGTAFLPVETSLFEPSNKDSLQGGTIGYQLQLMPPKKICKDDTAPVLLLYYQTNVNVPVDIYMHTNAGTLSKSSWSFPAGAPFGVINSTLTAKNVGNRDVAVTSSLSKNVSDISWDFEVIDCNYKLYLDAFETKENELVSWDMMLTGKAKISSQDMNSVEGYYSPFFTGEIIDEKLKSGSEGLACALVGSTGESNEFDVTGSKTKNNITLSIQFKETNLGEGIVFHCIDNNGVEFVIPLFESKKVNPGDYVPLSPSFSKGVSTYKFKFGESGSGTYTLVKRSGK